MHKVTNHVQLYALYHDGEMCKQKNVQKYALKNMQNIQKYAMPPQMPSFKKICTKYEKIFKNLNMQKYATRNLFAM